MDQRIALGLDPDTNTTAWAIVSPGQILSVGMIRRTKGVDEGMVRLSAVALPSILSGRKIDVAVVEGQEIYLGSPAAPNDIVKLAQIAGALLGQLALLLPETALVLPTPATWKKQTPKPIHQARVLSRFGLLYEQRAKYSLPAGCAKSARIHGADKLKDSDWLHVSDAVGLAAFGLDLLQ